MMAKAESIAAVHPAGDGSGARAAITGGLLVVLMLGAPDTGLAQAGDRWTRPAAAFVRLLEEERFDSAAAMISDAVPADALSPERLGQIWTQITSTSGPLLGLVPQSVTEQNGQHIVDMEARFERQPLRIRVVLDDALELTGLWFLPPEPPAYSAPEYVDTTAFREFDLTVGEDPWALPATLTLPVSAGPHPVVVLVHGSGPHDRDETIGPNRPFRDLAEGLASRGVGVLRYEKRTRVHAARIDPASFTVDQEVIEDALAALEAARIHDGVDPGRVFLAGHSLGGMLAPEIARRDGRVAGVALLAAPARRIAVVLRDQFTYIASLAPTDSAARASLEASLDTIAQLEQQTVSPATNVMGAPASYYYDLDGRDPVATAAALDVPVLVIHGGRDYQVTERDLALWRERLSGDDVTIREFAALNHLFIQGTGRATPTEYYSTPGHVARSVIEALTAWISELR